MCFIEGLEKGVMKQVDPVFQLLVYSFSIY